VSYLDAHVLGAGAIATLELLELGVLVPQLGVECGDLLAQVADLLYQLHVLFHDVIVVLLVYLSLLLEPLLEGVDRVLEVALLILVLLLDVWVDLDVLDLLLLHVGVQVLIHCTLKLVEVIDKLHCPVHCIGESLDEYVVSSYLRAVLLDQLLHVFLPGPQIIDDVAEISIDLIEMLEVLVHVIGLLLEAGDLHLAGGNVALELLDLVVEDELELLQFLSLLLQLVNFLLAVTDKLVFRADLGCLVLDLLLQGLQDLTLVRNLDILLLLVTLELLNVTLEVLVLVLSKLELSLGLQGHVLDVSLILHVLLVDLIDLELGIGADLSEGLLVVLADLSDVVAERLGSVLGSLHVFAELLEFLGHTLVVLFDDAVHLLLVF